ncbi:MAG: UPF0280 family protein, partial [Pseudomonadota bacterium]
MSATAHLLPDGRRLHLQHGPIDLLISVEPKTAAAREAVFARAFERFQTILAELVEDLPILRRPLQSGAEVRGSVARRMVAAVQGEDLRFVT